jgi:hypothetical protein
VLSSTIAKEEVQEKLSLYFSEKYSTKIWAAALMSSPTAARRR